jgi:hypothetical protein
VTPIEMSFGGWIATQEQYLESKAFGDELIRMGAATKPLSAQLLTQAIGSSCGSSCGSSFAGNVSATPLDVVDRVLSWDIDKNKAAGKAWARAIARDLSDVERADPQLYRKSRWGMMAQGLLDRGIPLQAENDLPANQHPLAVALMGGYEWGVKQLLAAGVDGHWRDRETGHTLLTLAAARAPAAAVRGVLALPEQLVGELANEFSSRGNLPLHLATAAVNLQLMRKLLDCGANPNALNGRGERPLGTMRRTGPKAQKHLETIREMLLEAGGKLEPAKHNTRAPFTRRSVRCRTMLSSNCLLKEQTPMCSIGMAGERWIFWLEAIRRFGMHNRKRSTRMRN